MVLLGNPSQFGVVKFGLVLSDFVWFGIIWFCMMSLVWCGRIRIGMEDEFSLV